SPSLEKFTVEQHSFDSANSLAFNNVLDLHEDREGMIWIGTDGGGLNRFNPVTREFHHYRHDPADPGSISSNTVLAIAEDSRGFNWLGTWGGGLDRLDPRTGLTPACPTRSAAVPSMTLCARHPATIGWGVIKSWSYFLRHRMF